MVLFNLFSVGANGSQLPTGRSCFPALRESVLLQTTVHKTLVAQAKRGGVGSRLLVAKFIILPV